MTGAPVPDLLAAAYAVFAVLGDADRPACLIGGMVLPRWGEPRTTRDVDCSVLARYGEEAPVVDLLLQHFRSRHADARAFALTHRVLLLESAGVGIDVALAALPFEEEAITRATPWEVAPGVALPTCPAEHLIVYKLVAARPQDLIDVVGIVRRQGRRLDAELVRRWGREFAELKEDPDLLRPFEEAWRLATR